VGEAAAANACVDDCPARVVQLRSDPPD
jgi:hypothetical protein